MTRFYTMTMITLWYLCFSTHSTAMDEGSKPSQAPTREIFRAPSYLNILSALKKRMSNPNENLGYEGQGFTIQFDIPYADRIFKAYVMPGSAAKELFKISEDEDALDRFIPLFFNLDQGITTNSSTWNSDLQKDNDYLTFNHISYPLSYSVKEADGVDYPLEGEIILSISDHKDCKEVLTKSTLIFETKHASPMPKSLTIRRKYPGPESLTIQCGGVLSLQELSANKLRDMRRKDPSFLDDQKDMIPESLIDPVFGPQTKD